MKTNTKSTFNNIWHLQKPVLFFKVENNSLELTRIFKESFKDQRWAWEESVSAEKRDRDAERERKRRFGVNAIISLIKAGLCACI